MVPEEERQSRIDGWVRRLRWKGPVFAISALAREGLQPLLEAVHAHVAKEQRAAPLPDLRFAANREKDDGAP